MDIAAHQEGNMGRTQKARPDSLRIKAAGVLWLRRFCATVALITASKGTVKSYVQNSLQAAEKALLYGLIRYNKLRKKG